MNSLLNFLNPKKSGAVKAKKSSEFFLEAADDEPETHAAEIVSAVTATVASAQTSESAIVVAEASGIAPVTKAAKSTQIKKFKGKGESASSDVIDAIATVVVTPTPAPEAAPTSFASTVYLSQTPRRRPGPSMAGFMAMAQQVKTK